MAYFYTSNYQEAFDNYHQHFDNYQYNYQSYDYDSHEPRYVQHKYDHSTSYYGNAYEFAVTPSIVGYHYNHSEFPAPKNSSSYDKSSDYYDQVTTQLVISYGDHKSAENDLDFEEYNPEPYNGGYDISETYGKALPPSDEICHPPSKIDFSVSSHLDDPSVFKSVPAPYGKEVRNVESEAKRKPTDGGVVSNVIQEENASDFEEDDDDEEEEDNDEEEDDDEDEEEEEENRENLQNIGEGKPREGEVKPTNGTIVSHVTQQLNASGSDDDDDEDEEEKDKDEDEDEEEEGNEKKGNGGEIGEEKGRNGGDYGKEIRRQIPPGYGLEAMDLCEGLLGGYFPCLSKRNQAAYYDQQNVDRGRLNDYDPNYEYVQGTVDYLFGNPNPYGGSMLERGSYGDPIYSYQRHHPQQSVSGQVQHYGENSSLLHNVRYYDGHNGGYQ